MNKDGDNFSPPNFEGFKVVGGPNQSVSNMWVNGKRTFSKSYSYFLSPLKKGQLTVGQATIEVDGKLFKTLPVNINVSESVKISRDPNDPSYVVNENLHLVAEVSDTSPYINEEFQLYINYITLLKLMLLMLEKLRRQNLKTFGLKILKYQDCK